MPSPDLYPCLHLLRKKSPLLFRKEEHAASTLQCLAVIAEFGSPRVIDALLNSLYSSSSAIRQKTAETIVLLASRLRSLREHVESLKYLPIQVQDLDFYQRAFDAAIHQKLVALASLNSNGYVREKAVEVLGRQQQAAALQFLLLRLGDPVPQVRTAAERAVQAHLGDDHAADWLGQLATLEGLLRVERVDLQAWYDRIITFLLRQDRNAEFHRRIRQFDDRNRRLFYKAVLERGTPAEADLAAICDDRTSSIRVLALRYRNHFSEPLQARIVLRFLSDRVAGIRLEAVRASAPFSPAFDGPLLRLTSDGAASVRVASRYQLRGTTDWAALYRRRIADEEWLAGSLLGLGETGTRDDLPLFENRLAAAGNISVIVAGLTALQQVDPARAAAAAPPWLAHPNRRIRSKAADILQKAPGAAVLETIRQHYNSGGIATKKAILRLYGNRGGWSVAGDLLLAAADPDSGVQALGWALLEHWLQKATTLFTQPQQADLERARMVCSRLLDAQTAEHPRHRRQLLETLQFYLR